MNKEQKATIEGLLDSISDILDQIDNIDQSDWGFTDDVQIAIDQYREELKK